MVPKPVDAAVQGSVCDRCAATRKPGSKQCSCGYVGFYSDGPAPVDTNAASASVLSSSNGMGSSALNFTTGIIDSPKNATSSGYANDPASVWSHRKADTFQARDYPNGTDASKK